MVICGTILVYLVITLLICEGSSEQVAPLKLKSNSPAKTKQIKHRFGTYPKPWPGGMRGASESAAPEGEHACKIKGRILRIQEPDRIRTLCQAYRLFVSKAAPRLTSIGFWRPRDPSKIQSFLGHLKIDRAGSHSHPLASQGPPKCPK